MSYNNYQQNDYNDGSAASYYNDGSNEQRQQYGHGGQQGHQQPPAYGQGYGNQEEQGQDGERGFLGAMAGGVAGAYGGGKLGGKATGHTKTSAVFGAIAGAIAGSKVENAAHDWKEDRNDRKEEEKRREEDERRRRDEERYNNNHGNNHNNNNNYDNHSSSGSRSTGHYAGAFTGSSRDIRLDNDNGEWNLRASCRRGDGSYEYSTLSLNRYLGNNNGSFQWSNPGGGSGGNSGGSHQSVTVQQGDTLRAIAGRFGCSWEELARVNNINNPDLIYPGQNLNVPGGGNGGGNNYSSGGGNFGASARDVRLTNDGQRLEASLARQNGDWVTSSINLDERISNDNGTLRYI